MKIIGTTRNEILLGGSGCDTLLGESGSDHLNGEANDDLIVGGGFRLNSHERDTLTGGTGADVFVIGDSYGAYYQDSIGYSLDSFAIITDFNPLEGDLIQVSGNIHDYQLFDYQNGVDILYRGDLIAVVENIDTASLDPQTDFIFA